MNLLEEKIIERIRDEGPITFETFMEMALYYPGLGYYATRKAPVGREGDFYTSSHLHPVFGAALARQLIEMWNIMGCPSDFHVVEIGAGAGHLCKDILDYLRGRDLFGSLTYSIVEANPFMKQTQEGLLQKYREKIEWVQTINELDPVKGCILSNELLDAFPVHLVQMRDGLAEVYVAREDDRFSFIYKPVTSSDIINYFSHFMGDIPEGYRTEINLRIRDWANTVSSILSQGFVLTIDYGYTASDYYSEERSRGTLHCFHRHRVNEDPFVQIGEQDITAHVNFSSLRQWGDEAGLQAIGYCPQGTYLVASGIDELIQELYQDSPDYQYEVPRIKNLILPEGLGESHKVLIQYKGKETPELRGFSLRNQVDKL